MLIRRVVPAIVATLAAYAGLAFATGAVPAPALPDAAAHQQLEPCPAPRGSSASSGTKGGQFAFSQSALNQVLQRVSHSSPGKGGVPSKAPSVTQYLSQHGYTQWTSYQPASRFWPFQWIEGGWLLALSVLLIAVTVWLVRRRAA